MLIDLGNYILSWITNKWYIMFYILPVCYFIHSSIKSLNKLRPKNKEELERDQKYIAFRRNDLDRITSIGSILKIVIMIPLLVPRFIFGWHGYIVTSILCIIINNLSFDMPGEKHYFKKTIRMSLIKAGNYYCSLCCFLGMGLWRWHYEDKNISYEKYLGLNIYPK